MTPCIHRSARKRWVERHLDCNCDELDRVDEMLAFHPQHSEFPYEHRFKAE
jgi:hypothetical protein